MARLYGFNREDARALRNVAKSVRQQSNKDQSLKYPQPHGLLRKKGTVRFTLDSALATSDETKAATITKQIGPGFEGATAITVYNHLTDTAGVYEFSGPSGGAGLAVWDKGTDYYIIQMQC